MSFRSEVERLLEPILNKVRMIAAKAIVNLIDDTTKMQLLQVDILKDEVLSKVERVQNYGFSSVPLDGAQAIILSINGNKEHTVAIAVDDTRYRVTGGKNGEVNVYDNDGNNVKLTKDDGIFINAPTQKVVIHASGDIEIGNTNLHKLVNDTFQSLFNSHTHSGVGLTGTINPTLGTCTITLGNVLLPNQQMNDTHLTSKVKAQ